MAARRKHRADRALRAPMRSPGRPAVARREHRQRFWAAIARGVRAKTRPPRLAFLLPWERDGSVKRVACPRSRKRHCRSAICLSRSARRSRFFMPQAVEFARSLAS